MATALTLVNRVLRKIQKDDVAEFQSTLSKAALDFVNEAIRTVLAAELWDFTIRHEGVLTTMARATGTVTSWTAGTTTAVIANSRPTGVSDFVARLRFDNDDVYGDTSYRASVWNGTDIVLPDVPSGFTLPASGTYEVFADEYLLPSDVRQVLSVRHQESDLRLEEVDRVQRFDRSVQRPHDHFSETPERVLVGGQVLLTKADSADADDRRLGIKIWPTPEEQMSLHYSYVSKTTELTTVNSTLDDIDPEAMDLIIDLAHSTALISGVGNNVEAGLALERRVWQRMQAISNREQERMPIERHSVQSLDRIGRRGFDNRAPRRPVSL